MKDRPQACLASSCIFLPSQMIHFVIICMLLLTGVMTAPALAQREPISNSKKVEETPKREELNATLKRPQSLAATIKRVKIPNGPYRNLGGSLCETQSISHTESDFGPGTYTLQAGFVEGEYAAASYTLDASDFPLKIETVEMLFSTNQAIVQTTTEWSFMVWDGTPTNGQLIALFSSDDTLLPHMVLGPGTEGGVLTVSVDPTDPDQIIISNASQTNTFTIGFRIDSHNAPGSPCLVAPNLNQNAFPTTDIDGVASPTGNWINAVEGLFCCSPGWFNFQSFSALCTPSGDWVMRASYTPFSCEEEAGACCQPSGTCIETTESGCLALGGSFQGALTSCISANCPLPTGACCVESTGGCAVVSQDSCETFQGLYQGDGTTCSELICFPEGACCLPTGECTDNTTPESCATLGGTFQGDGTSCTSTICPDPTGTCCADSTSCFQLAEDICLVLGGIWGGPGTTCLSNDPCATDDCPTDFNDDDVTDLGDFSLLLVHYGTVNSIADANGDNETTLEDFSLLLISYGQACP